MLAFNHCCFNSELLGKRTECDRLSCRGKHEFGLYYRKVSGCLHYLLNRKELNEYWKCCVQDQEEFCPEV